MLCVLKLVAMWLARWEEQNTLEASPGGDGIMAFKRSTAMPDEELAFISRAGC